MRGTRHTVWVAPEGRRDGAGTESDPVGSLGAARDLLRSRFGPGTGGPRRIVARGGRYTLERGLLLDARDAAPPGEDLVIEAAQGESPVFLGSRTLPRKAMRWVKARGKSMVRVDLRACGMRLDAAWTAHGHARPVPLGPPMPFVDGAPLHLASWPRHGAARVDRMVAPARVGGWWRGRGEVIECHPGPCAGGGFPVWLDGVLGREWEWSFVPVRRLDPARRRVELAQPSFFPVDCAHAEFRLVNVEAALELPGEYVVDWRKGELRFLPPDGFDMDRSRVEISWLDRPLVRIRDAGRVVLRGLEFAMGRDTGLCLRGATPCLIEDCRVRHTGREGVSMRGAGHRIAGSVVEDTGGAAVAMDGGDTETLAAGGMVAEGCVFRRWGNWRRVYAPAASLRGVGQIVRQCVMREGPHMAVEVRGNDHAILGNEIAEVCRDFSDMGAIYFNLGECPLQRGTRIEGNWFHDIGRGRALVCGVYLDRATQGVTVAGNLFERVGDPARGRARGILANHASGCGILDNWFVDCALPVEFEPYLFTWGKGEWEMMERGARAAVERVRAGETAHAIRYPGLEEAIPAALESPEMQIARNTAVYERVTATAPVVWAARGQEWTPSLDEGNRVILAPASSPRDLADALARCAAIRAGAGPRQGTASNSAAVNAPG